MKNYVNPKDFCLEEFKKGRSRGIRTACCLHQLSSCLLPMNIFSPTLQQIAAIKIEVLELPQLETCQNMPGGQARYCMVRGQHMQ